MEFDPAITLRVVVVILLIAVCLGVFYAARDWWSRVSEEDLAEEVHSRLEAIGREIALLATQIRHLEEVEGLQREVARLRGENQRLQQEYERLLDEVARVAALLRRPQ
jgi:predicted RNase H-like nuclease (RuvC/YqgF family)